MLHATLHRREGESAFQMDFMAYRDSLLKFPADPQATTGTLNNECPSSFQDRDHR